MTTTPATQTNKTPGWRAWLVFVAVGTGWGLTGPFSKLAVSTGHHPLGITFWDTLFGAIIMTGIVTVRRSKFPVTRKHIVFYLLCGLIGTAFPGVVSYAAYVHLPVGVNVIILSIIPLSTMMLSIIFGLDRPDRRRLLGLAMGLIAVMMIFLPKTSLPDPSKAVFVILPVLASLAYAAENIYVAAAKPGDIDAITLFCGLSWGALAFIIPALVFTNGWVDLTPMGPPERAILTVGALHICAYLGYLWLIEKAGPVFAAQIGYAVTGAGVFFGMVIYGERHSLWVWAALATIVIGVLLVTPRAKRP